MTRRLETATRAPRRLLRNISVATRLALVVVLVALVSVVVTSLVGLNRGRDLAGDEIADRLTAVAAARADQVERYVAGIERAVTGQALSPRSAAAIAAFADSYEELSLSQPSGADQARVDSYYSDVVAPALSAVRDRPVSAGSLIPVSPAAITLQAEYVVPPEESPRSSRRLDAWAELHDPLDQSFQEFVLRNDVDDFYLIEPNDGVIVYSAAKEIDFGTSLRAGPHSGSGLAALVKSLSDTPEAQVARIRDYSPYSPASDRPSAFVASAVYSEGRLAGYVAVRFEQDQLTAIMTNGESWGALGDGGESYLVAADDLMRSDARGLLEDKRAYLDAVRAEGAASDEQIRSMDIFDTTVLFQPVDYRQVDAALTEDPDVVSSTNYLGNDVLSARRPLGVDGLEWAVFAEADIDEIEQPIDNFVRNLLVTIAIFIVVVTFLAVRWADRLLEPLRIVSGRLRAIRKSEDIAAGPELPANSAHEFVDLVDDIDTMVTTLGQRSDTAARRAEERRQVLRRLLPAAIAERAEAGDRDVVEQIPSATVAVFVLGGLGSLVEAGSPDHARHVLDRFVEEADDLGTDRGVDRIRLTGDTYTAGCGASRPHLDHASRVAAFALEVLDMVEDLDGDERITVAVGVDSGPLTVGLTGGSRLVHDTWGVTVQRATDLARRARPGEILASSAVRSQLPSNFALSDVGDDDLVRVDGLVSESQATT